MPSEQTISLLVPYSDSPDRDATWAWLRDYWIELPDSEIVMGIDRGEPFSKTGAVNSAFHQSHGDIIVILDADAFLDRTVITHCAARLRAARQAGVRTWMVPYQRIYRLTKEASDRVLASSPANPVRFPSPPLPEDAEGTDGSGPSQGRLYGAMAQIMPREAFEAAGHMDPRFRGWGGEDVAFLRAVDTLWGKHKNTPNDMLHLWHKRVLAEVTDAKKKSWEVRVWRGQSGPRANDSLTSRYHQATGDHDKMEQLVGEHVSDPSN